MAVCATYCIMSLQVENVRNAKRWTKKSLRSFARTLWAWVVKWLRTSNVGRTTWCKLRRAGAIPASILMSNVRRPIDSGRMAADVIGGAAGARCTNWLLRGLLLQGPADGTWRNQRIPKRTRTVACAACAKTIRWPRQATCKPIPQRCVSQRRGARTGRML